MFPHATPQTKFQSFCFAEAPCKDAVEMARAAMEDAQQDVTPAVREFAAVRANDAEEKCHKLFLKYGLAVPVTVDTVELGTGELMHFPYIKFSSWLKYLMDENLVEQLCGVSAVEEREAMLKEFWLRYESLHGEHELFRLARQGRVNLARCLPIFAHADEGRTYRSKALLVVSLHGALGRGTRSYQRRIGVKKTHIKQNAMGMNYVGATWANHFLSFTMLRTVLQEHPNILDRMMCIFSTDMEMCAVDGCYNTAGTEKLWAQIIGLKADLPALQKFGGFRRNFACAPKKSRVGQIPCRGICHLCLAGQEVPVHIPFEDYSDSALWPGTCFQQDPWDFRPMILNEIPLVRLAEPDFFRTDMWHNWHNGLAKVFLGSSVGVILQEPGLISGNSIDAKFKWLSEDYLGFCKREKIHPFLKELSKETFAYESSASPLQGTWSKASVSTHLMLWLGDFCARLIEGKPRTTFCSQLCPCQR